MFSIWKIFENIFREKYLKIFLGKTICFPVFDYLFENALENIFFVFGCLKNYKIFQSFYIDIR